MAQLYEIKVKLSDNQKKNLSNAYHKRETIVLRLSKGSLSGNDTLYVPQNTVKRLEKNRQLKKGMDIKLAKTNIRKKVGGSLLTSILSLGRAFAPTLAKTIGLSALAGAASEGASQIVKKISGKGVQTGGFIIPQNKISQLIPYKVHMTTKQKKDMLNAILTGGSIKIKPTKTQSGGFLGTLLASIGIPLAIEAIRKITGKGAPQMGQPKPRPPRSVPNKPPPSNNNKPPPTNNQDGGLIVPTYRSPPFFGSWPDGTIGMGIKNKVKKKRPKKGKGRPQKGKGLLLVKDSPFKNIPLLNILL